MFSLQELCFLAIPHGHLFSLVPLLPWTLQDDLQQWAISLFLQDARNGDFSMLFPALALGLPLTKCILMDSKITGKEIYVSPLFLLAYQFHRLFPNEHAVFVSNYLLAFNEILKFLLTRPDADFLMFHVAREGCFLELLQGLQKHQEHLDAGADLTISTIRLCFDFLTPPERIGAHLWSCIKFYHENQLSGWRKE